MSRRKTRARRERAQLSFNLTFDRVTYEVIRLRAARANISARQYLHQLVRRDALTTP